LPIICYEVIEGGQKGQRVALVTELAINKFFSLGVSNIQNECNNVARLYSALWNTMPPEKKMSEYNLPYTTYTEGRSEILLDFILFEPSNIHIHIFNGSCPSNRSTPAITVQPMDNPMNPTLFIYLEALEVKDLTIKDKRTGLPFESIIYHELLHACGDSQAIRKEIHDGVIRHTMVCNEAINNLCKQSGNS
jgi:hypothetical protein